MKNYTKSILGITLIALFALFANQNLSAQKRHKHPHPHKTKAHVAHKQVNHAQAVKVFKRTNLVIVQANKALQKNKVYTGSFSKAVHHQRYAKLLYKQNKRKKALQHTRLARLYAFKTIRTNRGTMNNDLQFTKEENELVGAPRSDVELGKELKSNQPDITFDDAKISEKELTDLEVLDTEPSDYKNE